MSNNTKGETATNKYCSCGDPSCSQFSPSKEVERRESAQDILDKYNLHSHYYPNGDSSKREIHDVDCKFCYYEDDVLKAMEEYRTSQPLPEGKGVEGLQWSEYRKTATVKAKLFEKGDEDGFTVPEGFTTLDAIENGRYNIPQPMNIPYISTLENQKYRGEFGKQYICVGINNEKWLVDKEIFEKTYEPTPLPVNKEGEVNK